MLSGIQSLAKAGQLAPLPRVAALQEMYSLGAQPRAGQFIVVFGEPGCGKSTFMEWYINEMDIPSIYVSADTDATDMTSRLGAMRTGMTVDDVKDALVSGGRDYIAGEISDSKIWWCYDSNPDLNDIADELACYVELYDEYPACIVIDNAMNVDGSIDDDQGGLRMVFMELRRLSRETGITVFALHHAREEGDPTKPPARQRLQGKVSQLPDLILGVALDQDKFYLANVKVRDGKSDPSGLTYATLTADPGRATFKQYTPPISYSYGG
jgi:energy-coupling factor transporter ATP-binding protein EcfA2